MMLPRYRLQSIYHKRQNENGVMFGHGSSEGKATYACVQKQQLPDLSNCRHIPILTNSALPSRLAVCHEFPQFALQ